MAQTKLSLEIPLNNDEEIFPIFPFFSVAQFIFLFSEALRNNMPKRNKLHMGVLCCFSSHTTLAVARLRLSLRSLQGASYDTSRLGQQMLSQVVKRLA